MIPLSHTLILGAILFCIGVLGVFIRRNAIVIFMCIELMLNSVNISLVAFSSYIVPLLLTGQVFAIIVITLAAVGATVGLAIVLALYRVRRTIYTDEVNLLKW